MSLEDLSFEQRDQLALLAKTLSENPDTRKDFLRMTKKVNPSLPIPELDIEDYTKNAVSKSEERVLQLEAKLREKDALDELNKRRQSLIDKGLVKSKDDIDKVEKLMLEKGMTNHETAAEYFDWMQQAAVPTGDTAMGYNPNPLNKFDLSKYWKNPQAGARDEAAKALQELRKNNRPIGF